MKFRRSVVYEIEVSEEAVRREGLELADLEEAADILWADNGPEVSVEHFLGTIEEIDGGHLEQLIEEEA